MKKIIALAMAILIAAISIPLSLAGDTKGDVNGDNKVNSADALIILQITVGSYKGEISVKADVNGDGKINSADALMVLQICVGLIEPMSATENITGIVIVPGATQITTTYTNSTKPTTMTKRYGDPDYTLGYKVGDKVKTSFKSKYMVRLYSNGNSVYVPSGEVNPYYPSSYVPTTMIPTTTRYGETTTTTSVTGEYFLYLDSVNAVVSDIVETTTPYTFYDDDYNVVQKYTKQFTNYISITFRGRTDKALSGKRIYFGNLKYGYMEDEWFVGGYSSFEGMLANEPDNKIKSNGSFEFTLTYKREGDISYIVQENIYVDYLNIFDTESEWENHIRYGNYW